MKAEIALRERVHYIVFGIISNAQDVLDHQDWQETCKKIPDYVQGIVNAAQAILAGEQTSDGDVKAKVRRYTLEVIDGAEIRHKAQEVVTNAIDTTREDVAIRETAKEVVEAAINNAAQKITQEASKDLSECAENVVAAAIISAIRNNKDSREIIAAKSLAVDAMNAAKASLERLYGAKFELVAGKQVISYEIRSASLDKCAKEVAATAIISATRSLERVIGRHGYDVIAARTLAADAVAAAKASLERLYGVTVETEDADQDHSEAVCKCLVKSVKELAKAVISPSARLLQESTRKDDFESLTAQWLANDAIRAAKESLENFYDAKVKKDHNDEAVREIAAAAVMSAARSLEKDSIGSYRNLAVAAQGLASNALDSAKASVDWIYRTKVAPETEIEGKAHQMFRGLEEVAKDIAEVAVNSSIQSLENIAEKHEWDLTATTRKLANDVLNSAKASLERLFGIKSEADEGPTLTSPGPLGSSLEYLLSSSNESLESVKGHEHDLWIAAESLANVALKSASTSLERLYSMANQMEDNIKHTAVDISKTLLDSSGDLRQKLEKEGLVVAARDLGCNAIASAAKAFPKLHEDEMSLEDIAGTDANLLNAAEKVSTVSFRASLGELFDRGFIGGLELDEATSYLATHAVVSAENLIDTLQTGTLDLDLEICKAATELSSSADVSAEGFMAGSGDESHQTRSSGCDLNPGTLFWMVTTYVEGLINGALRNLGADGYYVDIIDGPDQYEVLTYDEARSADMEYSTHVYDIYQLENLSLTAARIVNDVVGNVMDFVKTRMNNKAWYVGQSVASGSPRDAQVTRRRRSSVHFSDKTIFRPRRDSYVPRETDFLSTANRPSTPHTRKGRTDSVATQEIQELEKELEILSEPDLTIANTSESGLVRRRSSDPEPECHHEDVASCQPERSASDSNIDINEQGTSINKKVSVYDIIKRREEIASCEISPCDSYVVLPRLNPSERFLIAARVESYEVLWKQRKGTPSVTILPSLSPRGSFIASDSVEDHPRKESKNVPVQSSSRLPEISSSASKLYGSSLSVSSLKGTSKHPKQTSSQQLMKTPKAPPKTSRASGKLHAKPSTEKSLQSPRASVGKVRVTSTTSLGKKEGSSRHSSLDNMTAVAPKASTSLHRASNTKVILTPGGSLTKANLSPRKSTERATLPKATSSSNQSSKLVARASTEKTAPLSRASLGKGKASPRGSLERVALTPRESTEKAGLSPRISNQMNKSSPRPSSERVVISPKISKEVLLSPRISAVNATLSPRGSKRNITQPPCASTENAVLSPRVSKGSINQSPRGSVESTASAPNISKSKVTQSPSATTGNTTFSPRGSKGKIIQSPRASTENAALSKEISSRSSRTSNENAAVSNRASKENVVQSPRASTNHTVISSRVSKGKVTQSPRNSAGSVLLSPRTSVGNVAQSSDVAGGTDLSSHASKENSQVSSPVSSEKTARSISKEFVQPVASVLNDNSVTLVSALDEKTATVQHTSLDEFPPSVIKPDDVVSALPETPNTLHETPPNQSANCLDSQDAIKTESTEKSKTLLKEPSHSVGELLQDSTSSAQKLEKEVEIDGSKQSLEGTALMPDVSQQQETDSEHPGINKDEKAVEIDGSKPSVEGTALMPDISQQEETDSERPGMNKDEKAVEIDGSKPSVEGTALMPDVSQQQETDSEHPGMNKDRTGGESMKSKHIDVNNSQKGAVNSLERLIQDKRLTPEGAEADTPPTSTADIAASRKYIDSAGPQRTFPAQLDTNQSVKSSLVEAPPSFAELPRSSHEMVTLKESVVDEEIFFSRKKPEGEDQSELEVVTSDDGIFCGKKEGEKRGTSTNGKRFQGPSTIKKEANDFEGYPTYRKVSVSRSIYDTVDDIVQRMLDSADEPNVEPDNSRPSGSDPLDGIRRDSEVNFELPKRFGRERNVSKTVIETVNFIVQTVSSADERRPRQSSGRQFNTGW